MSLASVTPTPLKPDTSELALTGWDNLGSSADWINALRLRSRDKVTASSLPTPKSERWKFTNLPARLRKFDLEYRDASISISGNSEYASRGLTQDWVRSLAEAQPAGEVQYKDMALWDAANAFLNDAVVIDVPANVQSADILNLTINAQSGGYSVPRIFIRLGDNADFTIVETHSGQGGFWNNALTQIQIGKNARLRHYRIQENAAECVYTNNTHVSLERDANYESFVLNTGSGLTRNQFHGELLAENGNCSFSGLNMLSGKQHGDTTLLVEHKAPHCQSNQLYRTILNNESRGVFQGKIHVHQIAQKTDGYQLSNNILLTPLAEMNIKPELEIYADDVKCSHGSTTGQLDETPMFYLRSRGLSETEARKLLLEAFIGEALEKITHEQVMEVITEKAVEWLNRL